MRVAIPATVDRRAIRTAIIDVIIVSLVLLAGILFHGTNPIHAPGQAAATALPFLIGWLLAAPIAGAYRRRIRESLPRSLGSVAIAWVAAVLLGSGLRAMPSLPGEAPITFVVVMILSGFAGLLPWRAIAGYYDWS